MFARLILLGLKVGAVFIEFAFEGGLTHCEVGRRLFKAGALPGIVTQVDIQPVQQAGAESQILYMRLTLLQGHLPGGGRGIGPRPRQVFTGDTHQVELATKLRVFAQMHPVLLDIPRFGMAEAALPRQAFAAEPLGHALDRRHAGLQHKTQLSLRAAAVQPVDIGIVLVQQQARGQQRAEQGAVVDHGLQRLMQRLRLLQGVTGRAVMPWQQALAEQKAAVIGRQ